jgi:hypothetical protein
MHQLVSSQPVHLSRASIAPLIDQPRSLAVPGCGGFYERRQAPVLGQAVAQHIHTGGAIDLDLRARGLKKHHRGLRPLDSWPVEAAEPTERWKKHQSRGPVPCTPEPLAAGTFPGPAFNGLRPRGVGGVPPIGFDPPRGRPGKLPAARGPSARATAAGAFSPPSTVPAVPHERRTLARWSLEEADACLGLGSGDRRASWRMLRGFSPANRQSIALWCAVLRPWSAEPGSFSIAASPRRPHDRSQQHPGCAISPRPGRCGSSNPMSWPRSSRLAKRPTVVGGGDLQASSTGEPASRPCKGSGRTRWRRSSTTTMAPRVTCIELSARTLPSRSMTCEVRRARKRNRMTLVVPPDKARISPKSRSKVSTILCSSAARPKISESGSRSSPRSARCHTSWPCSFSQATTLGATPISARNRTSA